MSLSFHPLKLLARERAAEDAVHLTLEIPEDLRSAYLFEPGQHLALRATLGGREVRRTYSILNGSPSPTLRLGIRVQSAQGLSHFLAHDIRVGEVIEALPPAGRFRRTVRGGARTYLALASGSGITPILSILTSVLEQEAESQCVLLYGSRATAYAMCLEELLALKNRYMSRFTVHCLMSREPQEMDVFNGRLDETKIRELAGTLFDPATVDEVFVCGPGDMVSAAREALVAIGVHALIHVERFATGLVQTNSATAVRTEASNSKGGVAIAVTMDGRRRQFTMRPGEESVLVAAERAGLELPYSCRSGVCATCRVKVISGAVTMTNNVALEEWELAAGFVLCCQSRPTTAKLELSYDEK
jgi:ring-1,2-phenylacetyl-CoA epoxidase subunit PaaE